MVKIAAILLKFDRLQSVASVILKKKRKKMY